MNTSREIELAAVVARHTTLSLRIEQPPAPPVFPRWRREPYLVMFPLALVLTWAGLFHWIALAAGVSAAYRSLFHGITLVQAVMTAFAAGFLLTFIPKRSGTSPAAIWELVPIALGPALVTAFAWFDLWLHAQVAWATTVVFLLVFASRRLLGRKTKLAMPSGFVWVPLSLVAALGASAVLALGSGSRFGWTLHDIGKDLLYQALMTGLVIGIGGMLLPMLTRGEAPPPTREQGDLFDRLLHAGAALLFFASFALSAQLSPRIAFGLRALIVLGAFVVPAKLWLPPTLQGAHRWVVWGSAWMLPLGFVLAAIWPNQRIAALHVIFIGSFAAMALSVAAHVILSHGGYESLVRERPWQIAWMVGLIALSLLARGLVSLDPQRMLLWIGVASAFFLSATSVWAALTLPRLRARATH